MCLYSILEVIAKNPLGKLQNNLRSRFDSHRTIRGLCFAFVYR